MSRVYYNEIDEFCRDWLRRSMLAGFIPWGDIDTRSIADVQPDDLAGYTHCHFFAGIGGWAYAASLAGWPADRPLWTGSCPCQPFSAAGKRGGADDPRHLWPDFFRLIRAERPAEVLGEQVAGALGYGWFDGVKSDLEGEGYAARAVDFPACAVDAPHIRNRLWWGARRGLALADDEDDGRRLLSGPGEGSPAAGERAPDQSAGPDHRGDVAHSLSSERDGRPDQPLGRPRRRAPFRRPDAGSADAVAVANGLNAPENRRAVGGGGSETPRAGGPELGPALPARDHGAHERAIPPAGDALGVATGAGREGLAVAVGAGGTAPGRGDAERTGGGDGGRNGTFWSDAEWIICHDGKARRTKPGLPLLADGIPDRVHLWRGLGNAIVIPAAVEVIAAWLDVYSDG